MNWLHVLKKLMTKPKRAEDHVFTIPGMGFIESFRHWLGSTCEKCMRVRFYVLVFNAISNVVLTISVWTLIILWLAKQ